MKTFKLLRKCYEKKIARKLLRKCYENIKRKKKRKEKKRKRKRLRKELLRKYYESNTGRSKNRVIDCGSQWTDSTNKQFKDDNVYNYVIKL